MFPNWQKVIDLLERLVSAVERIADAEATRTQTPTTSEAERSWEKEDGSIRLRDVG